MKKKRKINIFRIIWVTGVFLLLITILLMVMDYKINYQYLEENYLYFYNCNNSVCTARVKDGITNSNLYSTYECGYEQCPTIKKVIEDSYVILEHENKNILYDFINDKIISDEYEEYISILDNYFIVTKNNYQGMIDKDNKMVINVSYDQLGYEKDGLLLGYDLGKIIAKKNDLYGIISIKDGSIIEKIETTEEDIENLLQMIGS